MRWTKFLLQFNFHNAHIVGNHNQVTNTLLQREKVNAVSIASHKDLAKMIDEYAIDPTFKDVMSMISLGKKEEPYNVIYGYLLYGSKLCVTHSMRDKVMYESHDPPYVGRRGIQK